MRTAHRPLVHRPLGHARRVLAAALIALGLVAATLPAAQAEQVECQISINGKEPKENKFLIKGKISPSTGKPVNAIIEVKHCKKDTDCGAACWSCSRRNQPCARFIQAG